VSRYRRVAIHQASAAWGDVVAFSLSVGFESGWHPGVARAQARERGAAPERRPDTVRTRRPGLVRRAHPVHPAAVLGGSLPRDAARLAPQARREKQFWRHHSGQYCGFSQTSPVGTPSGEIFHARIITPAGMKPSGFSRPSVSYTQPPALLAASCTRRCGKSAATAGDSFPIALQIRFAHRQIRSSHRKRR
jgi:hypothetical protein